MYEIYVLKDPRTNEVRYVGCSRNTKARYFAHLNSNNSQSSLKRDWIAELRNLGLKPIMEVIDKADETNYLIKQKQYITNYRKEGINLTNTGYEDKHGNNTSFKQGHNIVAVVALNLDGSFYNSYNSLIEAAELTNTTTGNIAAVLAKRTKTASKFIWIYEKDYYKLTEDDIDNIVSNALDKSNVGGKETRFEKGGIAWNKGLNVSLKPKKNIHQYSSKTGQFIKTWNTAKEAAIELNGNEASLGQCARGKSKTASGYIWSYIKYDYVEPILYTGKTNNKILNNLK